MSDQSNIQQPWQIAGISRRTWYRRRAVERGGPGNPTGVGSRGRYSKSYYMANREKFRGYALNYMYKNIEKVLLCSARVRARKRGLIFNIDISDIVVPEVCPVLGIPIFVTVRENRETKRNLPNSPSLDRINPGLGYIKGNVRVISWRANNLKSDGSLEEFRAIVRDLEKQDQ